MSYETEFVNNRNSIVSVIEDSREFLRILPHESSFVESWDAKTTYARYSKIIYLPDDKIRTIENPKWVCPYEGYTLDLFNEAGHPVVEVIMIGGKAYGVPRGLVRTIPVDVHLTAFIFLKRIVWQSVVKKIRDSRFPDFICEEKFVELVREPRSKREIARIKSALEAEHIENARREFDRLMPESIREKAEE